MIRIALIVGGLALALSACAELGLQPDQKTSVQTVAAVAPDEMFEAHEDDLAMATEAPPPVPKRKPTISTAEVREIQTTLRQLGHDPGPVDGIIGRQTRNAVRAYQASTGLPVDGMVTRDLITVLRTTKAGATPKEPPAVSTAKAAPTAAPETGQDGDRGVLSRILSPLFGP